MAEGRARRADAEKREARSGAWRGRRAWAEVAELLLDVDGVALAAGTVLHALGEEGSRGFRAPRDEARSPAAAGGGSCAARPPPQRPVAARRGKAVGKAVRRAARRPAGAAGVPGRLSSGSGQLVSAAQPRVRIPVRSGTIPDARCGWASRSTSTSTGPPEVLRLAPEGLAATPDGLAWATGRQASGRQASGPQATSKRRASGDALMTTPAPTRTPITSRCSARWRPRRGADRRPRAGSRAGAAPRPSPAGRWPERRRDRPSSGERCRC